jgi:hypothetical protein
MEPIHKVGKALEQFPAPDAALEDAKIESRIQIEEEALDPRLPILLRSVIGKQFAHV